MLPAFDTCLCLLAIHISEGSYFCKKLVRKLIFCMQIAMKASDESILLFWLGWSSIPKVPKIANLQCLYNISKKKLKMKLVVCMQINIKSVLQVERALKFPARWYYHYLWAWLSIFKVWVFCNKFTISVQCLKKEIRDGVHFLMQINIKFSTSWHYRFWWVWSDVSKALKIGSWQYFCNIFSCEQT